MSTLQIGCWRPTRGLGDRLPPPQEGAGEGKAQVKKEGRVFRHSGPKDNGQKGRDGQGRRVHPSYLEIDEEEKDYRGRKTGTPTETRSTAKDRLGRRGPANDLYELQEGEPIEQLDSGLYLGSSRGRYLDRNRE